MTEQGQEHEQEPDLVLSAESGPVEISGHTFSIEIFRLEQETQWTLEVVDELGASHVWHDTFKTAKKARQTALSEIKEAGATRFIHDHKILPFPNPKK